jgi:thiol-disulfide isomerase/thioredoxin
MRERLFVALLLGVAALVVVGCGQERYSASQDVPASPSAGEDRPPEVKLEVVKYDQLLEALKARRGQVIVLDVWASWCVPCKQEFPHLVELHQRHAKDGVVCVSVSLDEPQQRDTALAFLKSQGAAFPNYLLDEGEAGWDKLDLKGIPAVFVYDRAGQLARKFTGDDPDNQFTHADVEKFVQELLARNRKGSEN